MSAAMVADGFHAPLASSASTSSLPSGLPMHNFIASLSSAPTRLYELPDSPMLPWKYDASGAPQYQAGVVNSLSSTSMAMPAAPPAVSACREIALFDSPIRTITAAVH